jgi:hypothetical protein
MTDDTGIFQHSKYGVPDPSMGYTTDDNARALIMAVMLYERYRKKRYEKLIYRYMAFLMNAQDQDGWFKNFMGYDRRFLEERGSEDCFGRCLWALGFTASSECVPANVRRAARHLLKKAAGNCENLEFPRAKAYSVIGLRYVDTEGAYSQIQTLAKSLADQYDRCKDTGWSWFEDTITYSNAVLPWAMLVGYKITREERFRDIGLESLKFLEDKTFKDGYFKPVGCKGWLVKGKEAAEFDEQPVEACEALLCYLEAYSITKEEKYLNKARQCYKWYRGYNSKGICLIDSETGGCYDGITQTGVNLNQGAESIISYSIAGLSLQKYCKAYARRGKRDGRN